MSLPKFATLSALSLCSSLPSHAFSPTDAVLTSTSQAYLYVPGDQAGGGTFFHDAPAALVGLPAGSTAVSSLGTSRTGSTGTRTGTSSGSDLSTAGYGLLGVTGSATVATLGDPFLDGDSQVDTVARFDDAVTYFNPNFAPGVAFTVRLTMTLSFDSGVSANDFARAYAYGQGGVGSGATGHGNFIAYESSVGNPRGDLGWHDPLVTTLDFSVVNGDTLSLWGVLTSKSESSLYNGYCDHCTGTAQASVNFASATYTLSGIDPGLEVATASGWLYGAAAVPEPAAAALWLAGLGALAGLRTAARTRRRSHAATP
jgi:hypothetical protein